MDIKSLCLKLKQPEAEKGSLPKVAEKVLSNFYAQVKGSKEIRQYLADIPKGSGTFCPNSPVKELVQYVGSQSGSIDRSDPDLNLAFIKKIVMPAIEAEQELVLRAIISEDKTDATDLEKLLIEKGVELSRATDKLWLVWSEKVFIPWLKLDKSRQDHYREFFKNNLNHYEYSVFDLEENVIVNRETWAAAFPEEINKILAVLKELAESKLAREDLVLKNYLESLYLAYGCREIDRLEDRWAEVDCAWIKISPDCRVLLMHGIEHGYEHPVCVSPEFGLEVRTGETREMIERFRKATVEHSKRWEIKEEKGETLADKLEKIDISVFVALIRGGESANHRVAGKVAPNRHDVLAIGGKIFLDNRSSTMISVEIYKEELRANCAAGAIESLENLITPEAITLHTVTHEYFHPVGKTVEIKKALGDAGMTLEETKATLGGIMVAKEDGIDQTELLAITLARVCRFMHKETISNPSAAFYVKENMAMATTLFQSGVMALGKEGISIELEKLPAWFAEVEKFVGKVIGAYQRSSTEEIVKIEKEYCNSEGSEIGRLIGWVNRDK